MGFPDRDIFCPFILRNAYRVGPFDCATVVFVKSRTGGPRSDEMRPEWFSFASPVSDADAIVPPIPYETMWDGDIHWLPLLIQGQKFVGRIDSVMQDDGEFAMTRHWFGTVVSNN
jgi:hypothetical protein